MSGFLKISDRKRIWLLIVPVMLLSLVIATTLGETCHRHINSSPETCPICHLSHQAIEPASAGTSTVHLVVTGPGPEPQLFHFTSRPALRQIPARAPPVSLSPL